MLSKSPRLDILDGCKITSSDFVFLSTLDTNVLDMQVASHHRVSDIMVVKRCYEIIWKTEQYISEPGTRLRAYHNIKVRQIAQPIEKHHPRVEIFYEATHETTVEQEQKQNQSSACSSPPQQLWRWTGLAFHCT